MLDQSTPISSLDHYLASRKTLINSRQTLFSATRTYLRPEQRYDAARLGDKLAEHPAWDISEDEWVENPVRGYLVILPNAAKGRLFRINVLQQGNVLTLSVVLPDSTTIAQRHLMHARFPNGTMPTGSANEIHWSLPADKLYHDVQAIEDAVYRVSALFEQALYALS